ncbi:hypothetical protein [Amycolatopsis pigmentata]|uniref:MbtH protein n=1 Tax=Amycolatopsis pigmentata TaxID=450801 RepID=A0ABW5G2Y4_9PSEU
MTDIRISPDDVVAVRDTRFYGGHTRPWVVVYVPAGHRSHWPTMSLHDQDVARWDVLRRDPQPQEVRA